MLSTPSCTPIYYDPPQRQWADPPTRPGGHPALRRQQLTRAAAGFRLTGGIMAAGPRQWRYGRHCAGIARSGGAERYASRRHGRNGGAGSARCTLAAADGAGQRPGSLSGRSVSRGVALSALGCDAAGGAGGCRVVTSSAAVAAGAVTGKRAVLGMRLRVRCDGKRKGHRRRTSVKIKMATCFGKRQCVCEFVRNGRFISFFLLSPCSVCWFSLELCNEAPILFART